MTRIHAVVACPLLGLLLGLMTACGTAEKRRAELAAEMDRWIGKPASEMIAAKGQPTGAAALPAGAKMLEYARDRVVSRAGGASVIMIPVNTGSGVMTMLPQTVIEPPSTMHFSCRLSVNVSAAGVVERWKADGNDC